MESERPGPRRNSWTFLTNHARVLIAIARDPGIRLRDIAADCGLTERTVQAIVTDLQADGYLDKTRDGRRNRYVVAPGARFRHPAEAGHEIAGLLAYLTSPLTAPAPTTPTPTAPEPTTPTPPSAEVANDTPGHGESRTTV
ncbi:helix-turn-helix transcriptional regulator [Streptomyces nojiriensis]|uniref:helix-turn-helix transcriptional regulator n=1 Tax=Streptomyces nojiriensis TaxID=66374 RepID=UPI0035E126F3